MLSWSLVRRPILICKLHERLIDGLMEVDNPGHGSFQASFVEYEGSKALLVQFHF